MKRRVSTGLILATLALSGCGSASGIVPQTSLNTHARTPGSISTATMTAAKSPDNIFHHVLCTPPKTCVDI